jgi:hypothetical protein
MRTVGGSDTADDRSHCRAYRSADRRAESGTSYSSTSCSYTSAHRMCTRLTRDRVGIFPPFFLHSVGCGIAIHWFANGRASGREEASNLTPKKLSRVERRNWSAIYDSFV